MIGGWEYAANALNAASIILAGRNSLHTWWTGILGCVAFGLVFYRTQLYADVTLQAFFVVASVIGWWNWSGNRDRAPPPVRRTPARVLATLLPAAALVAAAYGWLLYRYTDAYAPFPDAVVLAFSVLGQFLLIGRRVESWWCWLIVNSVAVPLFASRGLYLTSVLYAGFWLNAAISLAHWRRLAVA